MINVHLQLRHEKQTQLNIFKETYTFSVQEYSGECVKQIHHFTDACVFVCVCVCVCVRVCACAYVCVRPPRRLITSCVIWTPYDWLSNFYSCYMAILVVIINGRGLGIDTRRKHEPTKSQLALYKVLIHCNSR